MTLSPVINNYLQVYLDGKPPSRDELEVSASITIGEARKHSKKHKKVDNISRMIVTMSHDDYILVECCYT